MQSVSSSVFVCQSIETFKIFRNGNKCDDSGNLMYEMSSKSFYNMKHNDFIEKI